MSETLNTVGTLTPEMVWAALKEVHDPELPISLVDLGLIYDVRVAGNAVEIDLTFTATACPAVEFIITDIKTRLSQESVIEEIKINIVWDPPWTKDRLSELARAQLRTFGVSV